MLHWYKCVISFISCRHEDPELCCSCTLRTQSRYSHQSVRKGYRQRNEIMYCLGSECVMFFHSKVMSLSCLPL